MRHLDAIALALAFWGALIIVSSLASAGVPLECEPEILAWCKTYPGPSDVNCEKMAHEECAHAPPSKAELCKTRAKRLCESQKDPVDRDTCINEKLQEC